MEFTDRQVEIIEKATDIIGDKGIQNLTTKKLASEMGFTEPALYRHFKGKVQILESLLTFYRDQLKNGLIGVLEPELNGLEKIKALMAFQFKHFSKFPALIMVIFAETSFQNNSILSKAVKLIMDQMHKMVIQIIEDGQQEGSIRDDISANQLATIIMGSMRITVLRWKLSNFEFNLIEEGQKLWLTIETLLKKT